MATACPNCGAQNAETAEWCNQCYVSLLEPQAPLEPGGQPRSSEEVEAGVAAAPTDQRWTCPVCEGRNPIAVAQCQTCGTDMVAAFTPSPEKTDDAAVKLWSGIPGGGHAKAGNGLTGVAVFLLVAMAMGFGLVLFNGVKTSVIGIVTLIVGAVVWVVSAYDVQRHVTTGSPWLLQPRILSAIAGGIIALLIIAVLISV